MNEWFPETDFMFHIENLNEPIEQDADDTDELSEDAIAAMFLNQEE